MRIDEDRKVTVILDTDEFFRTTQPYGESDQEVVVQRITINGSSAWCRGCVVRKDGTLGTAQREVILDLDDLPIAVAAKVLRFLMTGSPTP